MAGNPRFFRHIAKLLCAVVVIASVANPVAAAETRRDDLRSGFLTDASVQDAYAVCRDYLMTSRDAKGLSLEDVEDIEIKNRHSNPRTGVTYLYMQQRFRGIEIEGANYQTAVDKNGRIVSEVDQLKRKVRLRSPVPIIPVLSAREVVILAARELGLATDSEITQLSVETTPMKETLFSAPTLSRDDIPLKLNYIEHIDGDIRLAWNIVIRTPDGRDWWNLFVDANVGEVLKKVNWVSRASYQVYPLPVESPAVANRSIVTGVPDSIASPFGWHDTDGIVGAEYTDTRGNNVFAQEDADADDLNGLRPDGGSALEFLTALDFQSPPRDYVEASVANLFYWTNILHDIFYQYGFDEAAGNFQVNNYGKGGLGGDSVHADVHDGSDTNNATMFTPKDGMSPILQTYLWTAGPSTLDVTTPHSSVGSYAAGNVALGTWAGEISGNVVLALDDANPSGPSTTDACTVIANVAAISGNIALVDRGTCTFEEKIANAQTAGASGIIIANNLDDTLFEAVGSDPAVSIPALFVGQSDGATLKSDLANGLSVTMEAAAQRDSAFENAIIAHEYAHGLTNRLTGGASNVGCLFNVQSRGLSEGWSDWFGIVLTATENDSPIIPRPFSAYVNFDPVDGPGIRNYPFSRDLGVSPLTFGQMQNLNRPHGIGEIWASVLWDLYWNMVDEYGFDSDFYHGTGGNNLLIQLVIDALKLQPCSPTFIEARDSLLTADLMNNGGANQCLIWEAAARRGVGQSAFTISSQVVVGIEAFDEPAICAAECGNNIIDAGEQCDDGNNAPFDGCAANCRLETPLEPLTGTAIGGSLVLSIAGVEVNIGTTAGQSAESVASALTDAVNNSTALQAVSSVAVSDQGKVVVTGEVTNFLIADIGLSNQANVKQVPVAWFWQLFAVLCLLSVALHALSKHSNARRHVK